MNNKGESIMVIGDSLAKGLIIHRSEKVAPSFIEGE
jgi:hypothetical protein